MKSENLFTNSETALRHRIMKCFSAVWAFIIIAPMIYFPSPSTLAGHPWKVELAASFFLFLVSAFWLLNRQKTESGVSMPRKSAFWVIVPFCLFIIWSGISVFWANSVSSVLHHTLVWFCYLIFFLFAAQVAANRRYLRVAVIALGVVIGIIGINCIIEYIFAAEVNETFGFRYAKFAEIQASILPLFFGFVLRLKRKHLIWAASTAFIIWLALLFSISRGAFLSSAVGLFVFIALRIFTQKTFSEKKRLIFATVGIVLIAVSIQTSIFDTSGQKVTTITRLVGQNEQDPNNSISKNTRFLFAGVGLEMFRHNRLRGIGADNFSLDFNNYRALFSAESENRFIANRQEESIPERAHNEYLQILAELGGVGALIFSCFIFGIAKTSFERIKKEAANRSNILTHSAIAGIVAFLVSSLFSSFSFRLMQNGLVFFFLLAILLRSCFTKQSSPQTFQPLGLRRPTTAFILIATAACLLLTTYSTLKATSQFFVYSAEQQKNFETAESFYKKAELLDASNASANYSFGHRLLQENRFDESGGQFRKAVEKGLNTTVCYSYLITAEILSGNNEQAEKSASEAVRIFPYSVFMRVRYASLLKKLHREAESLNQFEIAGQINKRHAETWRLLIDNGARAAGEKNGNADKTVNLEELTPYQAITAVLTERETLNPQEKTNFDFGN